jgi:hypothetical protein
MGNPCDEVDMEPFYAATKVSIGNGNIAPFWEPPWLHGRNPKDIAPSAMSFHAHYLDNLERKECKGFFQNKSAQPHILLELIK